MNRHAKAWVKALRSGDYAQGRGALRDGDRFCCLGVACDLFAQETVGGTWLDPIESDFSSRNYVPFAAEGEHSDIVLGLPHSVADWLGLSTTDGRFLSGHLVDFLANRNDRGASFADIADIIESEPQGLFRKPGSVTEYTTALVEQKFVAEQRRAA